MSVIVGYRDTDEARAALKAAAAQARNNGDGLVVIEASSGQAASAIDADSGRELEALRSAGTTVDVRAVDARGDLEDAVLDAVDDPHADLIVVGVRHRTAIGKFLLGSNAQRVILGADCHVLVVKTDRV